MDGNNSPIILVIGCDSLESSIIIKMMLEDEGLPVTPTTFGGLELYPWHISTKYYETDVMLYPLSQKTLLYENLTSVEAVVFSFDSSKDEGLKEVEKWLPFLKTCNADINILTCHQCSNKLGIGISKIAAQEWCVQHGFELVELEPNLDEDEGEDLDFEAYGIKRIVQALHAHVWPNLVLKERTQSSLVDNGDDGCLEDDSLQLVLGPESNNLADSNIEGRLEELLGGGADTDFYHLFGELHSMKERVAQLSDDQRKACAEQVVLSFWRAIGGDADEVESIMDPDPSMPT